MTFSSKTKKLWLTLLIMTTGASLHAASLSDIRIERVKHDMNIMTKIIDTAFEQQMKTRSRVQSVYLAGQGMLFTIGQNGGFNFHFGDLVMPEVVVFPDAPSAPSAFRTHEFISEHELAELEEHAMLAAESAMEMAEVSLEYMSDVDWSSYSRTERNQQKVQQKQLRDEKRSLEKKARKLEREVRDVERQLRDSEFESQFEQAEKNSELSKQLENKMKDLTGSLGKVVDELKTNSEELKKKAEKVRQEQEKRQKEQLAKAETIISRTVCDFGSGLRSLPDGQHISFQMEGRANRLYVFTKDSVMSCGQGKITAEQLLEKATSYTM